MVMNKYDFQHNLTKPAGWIAVLLSALLVCASQLAKPAQATDIVPVASQGQAGHFFRIALNKSAVVTLPGNAKDVIVGNNEIVDVVIRNKNTAYLFARKTGSTNLFFFDANGQQIMAMDLEVALDSMALQNLLRRQMPGTHITVDVIGSNAVLGGIAINALEAKTAEDLANEYLSSQNWWSPGGKVVNSIKIAGEDQVLLQVRIVEMQRDVMKQWGINVGAVLNAGAFAFNLSSINPFVSADLFKGAGYGGAISDGNGNSITGILKAMESDGVVHTLAEPNLTSVSGQAASFKAGGEFPYQTCQVSPTGTVCSIAFKEYGVGLNFTPTVLSAGRINLKIHTDISEISQSQLSSLGTAGGTPSLNTRSADTVLEMPDGGSMMLAGLIRENSRQTINGTPGLRKLPILGALFRSREFISNQTELVVLVTPHIVRSLAQQQLETPDKNFNMATDGQTMLMGRLNKIYGGKDQAPHGSYGGNVGYVVE